MKYLFLIATSCCILIASSCNSDCDNCEGILTDCQYEYFPLEVGNINTFRIDSILINGNPGDLESRSHWLKEEVTDTFMDGTGEINYRVQQYLSDTNQIQYVPSNSYRQIRTKTEGLRSIGNLLFKVLEFPVSHNEEWNGTKYFDKASVGISIQGEPIDLFFDWGSSYTYTSLHESEVVGAIPYDSVLTVVQGDHESLTERRFSIEKYAKHTGLVYKEMLIISERCNQVDDLCQTELEWIYRGDKGFWMRQVRIN